MRPLILHGNSGYRYYGIPFIPGSELNQLSEDGASAAICQQPPSEKCYKLLKGQSGSVSGGTQKTSMSKIPTIQPTEIARILHHRYIDS
jgi:hypothetical protein